MQYLILGVTEARDGHGRTVPLGGHRLRALLAALVLHADSGTAMPVDTLIAEVWAGADALPDDAPAALQALVGRLRRALGKDAVRSLPGGYRLAAEREDIDLFRFQRLADEGEHALAEGRADTAAALLRDALGLWRGPALADLPDRTSAAARCEAAREAALQARIAADLALGDAVRVLPELRELTAARPLDEPLHALLVTALRDTGRPAEALEAYETVRSAISARLGADPGEELRSLHAQLLTAADGAGTTGAPGAAGPSAPGRRRQRPERDAEPQRRKRSATNLRTRLTSFVGREADLDTLRGDLRRSRLVTLTGPGGSGKTRLAEQAAAAASGQAAAEAYDSAGPPYPDGAWMVELAPLSHPSAVPGAVLSALGQRATALFAGSMEPVRAAGHDQDGDATARLLEHCAGRRLLLVLDNCEHVVDAVAHLAETLLAHCPGLTVLATSREPLGIPGEAVRPVEPLPPAPAHRLFADRAAAASPGFRTDSDPESVAEICARLDGLPLAIELAAARLRSLTPRQIADRLDDRFRLLTSGSRTVLPRQQTLRAVVDWSWDLLDERERTVLRRLSVFSGGCTLPAAEYVCADDPEAALAGAEAVPGTGHLYESGVLDVLGSLVDKSILIAAPPPVHSGTGLRYRMLETIHEYAKERAAEHPGDRARAERRHTAQIVRFTSAAEPRVRSAEQLTWLPRLEADLDNVRSALQRTLEAGDAGQAFGLVRAMGWFWSLRNYRDEGSRWALRTLALFPAEAADRDGTEEARYRDLQLLGYFLLSEVQAQELLENERHMDAARELLEVFGTDHPRAARFPGMLWPFVAYLVEGVHGLLRRMDTAVAICRRHGGRWEIAVSILFRAHMRLDAPGGNARADESLPEIDALAQTTGDRWLLSQVCGLRAEIATQYGRYDEARAGYETALRYARQMGAIIELPFLGARIAETWYRQGDNAAAEKLARQAVEEADRIGLSDAVGYGSFLRCVIALEDGETERARALHDEMLGQISAGTSPPVFGVGILALDARITAEEGRAFPDGIRKVRDALKKGTETGMPELLVANVLLAAALVVLAAGRPHGALRLAEAAEARRGELAPSVPELRHDAYVREQAAAAGPEKSGRPGTWDGAEAPSGLQQSIELLDSLLEGPAPGRPADGLRDGPSGTGSPSR